MNFDIKKGLLTGANFHPSPYYDARPANALINLLVIHGISLPPGIFTGNAIDDFFCGRLNFNAHPYFQTLKELRVSAHVLIRRDGELIQYVSFLDRAWHAGKSEYRGQTACNDFSIGIELEGTDELAYTALQYQMLTTLTEALMRHYPHIVPDRIVGHSDIAPGRKTDPGSAFDWGYYRQLLAEKIREKI